MLGFDGVARIFEWIEQQLIASLKRNLTRHRDEEKRYGFNWSAWQTEKLKSIERFRRENREIMQRYTEQIGSETRALMEQQFAEGVNSAAKEAEERIKGTPAGLVRAPQFFGVDSSRSRQLIEDIMQLEEKAETAALRLVDDVYRQTLTRVQLAMSTGSMTLQKAIDTAVKDFLEQGINCIVYKDGRRVNIADYVRMALRTAATRSAIEGKSAKYAALGFDTVQVSSYGQCSKTCLPWQGRVYINDAFAAWSGESEVRDGILWGRSNYCGRWFPLLSSAIEQGLFHPNCRHSISLWRDGDPEPRQVDNTDSERLYKLEQRQRALERAVRAAKRKAEGFTDPENIRKAKAELREAQKQLREFIAETNAAEGRTVLKYDAGKVKVYDGERVDNPAESVIIEEKHETAETDVHELGRIDIEKYKCITEDITTDEVIITDERIQHINDRHPGDYEFIKPHIQEILDTPDYILEDSSRENTGLILKELISEKQRVQVVLRLHTSKDDPEFKNSVISAWKISTTRWNNYIKNKKTLYKSE